MAQYAGRASIGLHTHASLKILSTSILFRHRMAQYAGRASVGLPTQASLTLLSTSTLFRHRMAQYAGRASVGLHTQASVTLLSTSVTVCIPAYHSGFSGIITESASNYGITARGKIITEIVDYGNLVTSGNNW